MKKNLWLVRPIVMAVGSCFSVAPSWSNPTGPQVMHGNVQIQGLGTNNLKVTNSPSSIIHWQGFSIGAGQVTQFAQQSASSAVLNRVVGADISQIHGQLLSNGRVFLINPAGILIGAGGVVDTAGFVGSTLNMLNADFLAGKLKFSGDASAGSIVNQGWIRTGYGGNIVLVAPNIENSGLIHAPGGELVLAAGQKMTIGSLALEGVQFEIQAPADSVLNVGKLLADGGAVGVFAGTLKHTGDIRANALVRDEAGRIVLKAQGDLTLAAGSTISADGKSGGDILIHAAGGTASVAGHVSAPGSAGRGGDIKVLGERVSLVENAYVDASGTSGGGQIRIGGDFQGGNAAIQNASSTFVGPDAALRADARDAGDGGRIIVWADKSTRYYGSLSTRGGAASGDGGFAEVSGKENLIFAGGADLSAPKGRHGELLLDPLDLWIANLGGAVTAIIDEAIDAVSNAVTVSPATLAAIPGNVMLRAGRYMRFSDPVTLTTAGQSLTAIVDPWTPTQPAGQLQNMNRIDIFANITTNGGHVTLTAPSIQSFSGSTIATSGGAIELNSTAGGINAFNLILNAGAGAVRASAAASNAGSAFVQLSNITGGSLNATIPGGFFAGTVTTTGPVSLASSSFIDLGNVTTAGGGVFLTSTGSRVLTSNVTAGAAGNVSMTGRSVSTGTIDTTGNVDLIATRGSVSATVNNAASLNASSSHAFGSASVSISQTTAATPLNATSIMATTTNCPFFCSGASVSINAIGTVNVGAISASAPVAFNNTTSESVSITSSQGSILGTSASSQITATDVTLSTGQGTGGGIRGASPLNVNVERSFTLRPNGPFEVNLNGTGPNGLTVEIGVAPAGQPYTGTLTRTGGGVALTASATDSAVTLSNITLSGINQRVFGQDPFISLRVPNGALTIPALTVPEGDTSATNTASLNVFLSSSGNLTLDSYTRQQTAQSQPKFTSISSDNGAVTLGTISGGKDAIDVTAQGNVTISSSVTTAGNVDVTSQAGNITLGVIDTTSGTGNVTLTANALTATEGHILPAGAGLPVEVTAGGTVSLTGQHLGEEDFPLDLAGSQVTLTTRSATSHVGGTSTDLTANTSRLIINTEAGQSRPFRVATGNTDLLDLNVTTVPSGGRVTSNGKLYDFQNSGANLTFAPDPIPAEHFDGGLLSLTTTSGDIQLGSVNLGTGLGAGRTTAGKLTVVARQGSITGGNPLDAKEIRLEAGTSSSGTAVRLDVGSIGSSVRPDIVIVTAGSSNRSGSFETAGAINAGTVTINTFNGGIKIGSNGDDDIGSALTPAGAVQLTSNENNVGAPGTIQVGDIFSGSSIGLTSRRNTITTSGLNAVNSISIRSGDGNAVTTAALDAPTVSIAAADCCVTAPAITTGAIGGTRPVQSLTLSGAAVNVGGAITGDPATSNTINLSATGALTLGGGGVITAGPNSSISLTNSSTPLEFSRIETSGATSAVTLTSAPGIEQTTDTATSGIMAATISLSATGGAIRNSADVTNNEVDLRGVANLTVTAGGTARLNANGSTLGNLTITKSAGIDVAPFTLSSLGSAQLVTITNPGGAALTVNSPNSLLNFTLNYNVASEAVALAGTGIDTSGGSVSITTQGAFDGSTGGITTGGPDGGGSVTLSSTGGAITTGAIDTSPAAIGMGNTGGPITITTNCDGCSIEVNGNLQTGAVGGPADGSIALRANFATGAPSSITTNGSQIISDSPASVIVTTANGNIGTASASLLINSPNVTLSASGAAGGGIGNVFATLTGTNTLSLTGDNGFNVASDTAFNILTVTTRGTGLGTPGANTLNLSAAASQVYAFDRPAADLFGNAITNTFEVITAAGATPAGTASFRASDGHLLVRGAANLASSNLTLETLAIDGDIKLQGNTASPLTLTNNGTQTFSAGRDLTITNKATITGGTQTLFSQSGAISLLGGGAANESVTITAGVQQTVSTAQFGVLNRDIVLAAGAADGASVILRNTGSGQQVIQAGGNINITGGGGSSTGSIAEITTATGSQLIRAEGNINLTGGAGTNATARIVNTGNVNQQVGEARCPFFCEPYLTDNVTLQGGAGSGSFAEIAAAGPQQVFTAFGTLSVLGGSGTNAFARIENTSANAQNIGDSSFDTSVIVMQAGMAQGAFSRVAAAGQQTVRANASLTLTARGTAGVSFTNAGAVMEGRSQTVNAGTIMLNGGAGTAGSGNTSDAVLRNTFGNHNVTASNRILMSGGFRESTTGILHLGAGSQTVSASSGIEMTGNAVGANADVLIRNSAATAQTITANNAGILLDQRGAGTVGITSAGTQSLTSRFLDVLTSAGSTGDAVVSATGNQYVRTTNGTSAPVASVRAAALGTGMASIDSAATQLLEIEYIEHMTGTIRPGSIVVGNTAAVGTSRLQGQDQLIFARTATIQGGSGAGSTSKITGIATQAISTFDGGLSVLGGSSANSVAAIDSITQSIVSNGALTVLGGSASAATAAIISTGTQLVVATKDDLTVQGGSVANATGRIHADGNQIVMAGDELKVLAGTAPGATALVQSGGTQTASSNNAMTVTAGSSADLFARVTSAGAQILNFGSLALNAGSAGGAHARIDTASTQMLTGGNVTLTGNVGMSQIDATGDQTLSGANVTLFGGSGTDASARITTAGGQTVNFTSLTLNAGAASGANAIIDSTAGTQTLSGGNIMLTANVANATLSAASTQTINAGDVTLIGGGMNAAARITTPGAQTISFGSLMLTGGTASGADAKIESTGGTQTLTGGNITLAANAANTTAMLQSAGAQAITAANVALNSGGAAGATTLITTPGTQTLNLTSLALNAGAGAGSFVQVHADGAQNITSGAITMTAGNASGAFAKIDTPSTQTLTGGSGNIMLTASSGAGATIEGHSQTISCGAACNIILSGNAGAAAHAQILNLSGAQTVSGGSISLFGGQSASTTAIRNQGTGDQVITASAGGITLESHVNASGAAVLLENVPATAQTITAAQDLTLVSEGGGTVAVTSGGTQSIDVRGLDVLTFPAAPGGANATVFAPGDQTIHTRGSLFAEPGVGMRVASLSTGTAKVESGGNQMINVDGNQLLIGRLAFGPPGPGNSMSGNPAAGDSLVLATSLTTGPNQTVRAGSVYIQGPTNNLRQSKLSGDRRQIVTTTSGGLSIIGGAGMNAFASVDPTDQTIISFGDILLQGGSGPNADALINATGPQTVTSQNGSITLIGGTGLGADALIATTSPFQTISAGPPPNGIFLMQGPPLGGVAGFQQGSNLSASQIAANSVTNEILREQDNLEEFRDDAASREGEEERRGRSRIELCS